MKKTAVYKLVACFSEGRENVTDEYRSGWSARNSVWLVTLLIKGDVVFLFIWPQLKCVFLIRGMCFSPHHGAVQPGVLKAWTTFGYVCKQEPFSEVLRCEKP
jgi:hypothetical protein